MRLGLGRCKISRSKGVGLSTSSNNENRRIRNIGYATIKIRDEIPKFFDKTSPLTYSIYTNNIVFQDDHIHNNFQIKGYFRYRGFLNLIYYCVRVYFTYPKVTILKMEEIAAPPGGNADYQLSVRFLFSGETRFYRNYDEYEGSRTHPYRYRSVLVSF